MFYPNWSVLAGARRGGASGCRGSGDVRCGGVGGRRSRGREAIGIFPFADATGVGEGGAAIGFAGFAMASGFGGVRELRVAFTRPVGSPVDFCGGCAVTVLVGADFCGSCIS